MVKRTLLILISIGIVLGLVMIFFNWILKPESLQITDVRLIEDQCVDIREQKPCQGVLLIYYPNGQLASEEEFRHGLRHGDVKRYHANGILFQNLSYNHGKIRDGQYIEWDAQGNKWQQMPYRQGVLHGELLQYHTNGQVACRIPYKNDLIHGLKQCFQPDGSKKNQNHYRQGRPQ